jgi:hypothetical protein
MSKVRLHQDALPPTNEPLRIAVRRLRWFKAAFLRHAETVSRELGCKLEVDEAKLAGCFMRWLDAIEVQRPADKSQRRAFFKFAAALMMRELTTDMPLKAVGVPVLAQPGSAAAFWPEGYCCTIFCLSVHAAATAQEFHSETTIDPAIDDLRHWWSFRENTMQDARFSAGFLQMLMGSQPNWVMPDVFSAQTKDVRA